MQANNASVLTNKATPTKVPTRSTGGTTSSRTTKANAPVWWPKRSSLNQINKADQPAQALEVAPEVGAAIAVVPKFQSLHLIASTVHDLKTPLAIISGVTTLLQRHDLPEGDEGVWLERLGRNVASMEHMVAEITDSIEAESTELHLNLQEVDLSGLTMQVVNDFSYTLRTHPIHVDADGSCPILGDAEHLKRMLNNLVSNAFKYSKPGRPISVSVWRSGADVIRLTVQDEGVGLPTAHTERLFLPFTRLDETSHLAEGQGLGLHSVKKIVEAHCADISLQGAPQQGTTVEVCFKAYWPVDIAEPKHLQGNKEAAHRTAESYSHPSFSPEGN